jgi:hypothetical protein
MLGSSSAKILFTSDAEAEAHGLSSARGSYKF